MILAVLQMLKGGKFSRLKIIISSEDQKQYNEAKRKQIHKDRTAKLSDRIEHSAIGANDGHQW
jgi:hypothetical protein